MADAVEKVVLETPSLQRFDKATPGVFIFGSYLGTLVLTTQRVLFLSAGGSGAERVLAGHVMGILTPEALRTVELSLEKPGSLAIAHPALRSCSARRRWDLARFLRIEYVADDGSERATSFIFRGPVLDTTYIDAWVSAVGRRLPGAG
jgi:hypothetical protein